MLRAWAEQRATAAKGEGRTLETEGTFVGVEAVYKNTDKQRIFWAILAAYSPGRPAKRVVVRSCRAWLAPHAPLLCVEVGLRLCESGPCLLPAVGHLRQSTGSKIRNRFVSAASPGADFQVQARSSRSGPAT